MTLKTGRSDFFFSLQLNVAGKYGNDKNRKKTFKKLVFFRFTALTINKIKFIKTAAGINQLTKPASQKNSGDTKEENTVSRKKIACAILILSILFCLRVENQIKLWQV
jgi:hypothetical protein